MSRNKLQQEGDVNLGLERKQWEKGLEKETLGLLDEDASHFIHQSLSTPCMDVVVDAIGPYLISKSGKKLLDFHGNNVHQVGYKNSYVLEAVVRQLYDLPFSPRRYTNHHAIALAKALKELTSQKLSRVLFAPSGAIANSMALKLARIKTGKYKVISMWGSFHGAGLDTISAGGESCFRSGIGPLLPGIIHVPSPDTYRNMWENDPSFENYLKYLEYVIEQEGDIGALIAETIRNTDVQIPPMDFWKKVRAICDAHGILLILDEIPIAMGRTGKFFAFEHYGIVPDMVTLGKGLGGAVYPISAILTKEELNVAPEHSVGHFTHEKSPVGAAAALASIQYIRDQHLLVHVLELEEYFRERLTDLQTRFSMIGDIRGIGLLWAIELVKDRKSKIRATVEAEKIMYSCLSEGLNFKVSQGNVLTLSPSLIISKEQLSEAIDILEKAFAKFLNA